MNGELKESLPQQPINVEVKGKRWGEQINAGGTSFNLRLLCRDPWTYHMRTADMQFDEVYFRTDSGNVYRLDPKGNLVNSNESRRQKRLVGASLNPRELERQQLTVGNPFRFAQSGHTTIITEIVAVNNREPYQHGLPYNSIIDDFEKDLPPQR